MKSNHGTGIIASMFGCKCALKENKLPNVEKISLYDAKRNFGKGLPNVKSALGKKVIETYQYYHERLKSFPKCYKAIRITQPDLQGPFGILHLILGDDAFCLPKDDPQLAKYMVEVIAKTYIAYRRELDPFLTDKIHDAIFVRGLCCGGRILLESDTAIQNLSQDLYVLCEAAPDSYIFKMFSEQGGGSLYYSGKQRPWHRETISDNNLRCISYGNSEVYSLKEEYSYFKKRKIAIVGWGANQYYNDIQKDISSLNNNTVVKTGITLMCKADTIEDGINALRQNYKYSRNYL